MDRVPSSSDVGLQRSLVDTLTERIRAEILSGRLRPGERIRSKTLEEMLGVSHIPIREALRRLEGEGLVENIPQRGAVVTPLSLEELPDVYELRKLIEPYAARRAAPASRERVRVIADAFDAMRRMPEEWTSLTFTELHQQFHWLILEPGVTPTMASILRHLWQTTDRHLRFATFVGDGPPVAARHHKALLAAVRGGDGDVLAQAVVEHLELSERLVRGTLLHHVEASTPEPKRRPTGHVSEGRVE